MKLLVALALAVQVSSSATDGPDKQVQLPPGEKPEPAVSDQSACAPVGPPFEDFGGTPLCTQFSSVCLVFDEESCSVKNDESLTEQECLDLFDDSKFANGNVEWCPCTPPEDFEDCDQFSEMCKVFDKSQCKVKNKGFESQAGCSSSVYDVEDFEVKWCRKQPLEKKCNCQRGGKKCVVRKESNGKILLRNQGTEACKPDDAFDCPEYDFLLDKFVNQD